MKLISIKLLIIIYLIFPFEKILSQAPSIPSVKINDHKENTSIINIDCDYDFLPNKGIQLTAKYSDIRQTNSYSISSIDYVPIGNFTQGEVVDIRNNNGKQDDTYNKAIDLPFSFCFYGNQYSQIIISDNGVVSFNTALAQLECPYAPPTPLPTGLPKNSIFGVFHDMQNINQVRYLVEGNKPNRKVIINYNNIPQYGYPMSGKNSTSQIVLYETSNIIDVYVKDRFKNGSTNPIFGGTGAYRKDAVIGLTNYDSSAGVVAPGRDTGNWEAHNEAWRFNPSGSTDITIQWFNEFDSEISGTRNSESILVYPTQNTKYKVKVTYNICTPVSVTDIIKVEFSHDFPTAEEKTTDAFCVDNGGTYTIDLTQYESEINPNSLLTFSYFEDQNLTIPISSKNAYSFSNNKTIYVKVLKSGVCYSISKLNLRLNKKPVINSSQFFEKCDQGNDGSETINLNSLGIQGLSSMGYKYFTSLDDANTGSPEITNYTNYLLNVTGELDNIKTLYLRVWNNSYNDPNCYTIVPFKIKLKKYVIVKKTNDPFLICNVIEGQVIQNYNLTQYEPQLLDSPSTGVNFEYYTNSSYATSSKISNPDSANFTMNTTIYVKATAIGHCDAYTQIKLAADDNCDGAPGGGGSGGGGATGPGGPGGGGGPICNTDEIAITVSLDVDYFQFYLQGGLTLSDITLIGFYDSTNNSLVTNTSPYTYTLSPPFFKVIQARYKINATGLESYVNFPISASKKAEINPNTFDICDTYNDAKENIILKSNSNLKPRWQIALESEYPGATIHFFATSGDLNNYEADPNNQVNNSKIITSIALTLPQTTFYVYVKYYGCIYTHEINFNLVPVVEESINQPYIVCDFNDDKKELINIIEITNDEIDVKSKLTPSQLTKLQTPIRYYKTLTQAHAGTTNYITTLTNFEINFAQMSVFAKLNISNECPVIVEVKFQFTTSVALPVLKKLIICDINNDNQEEINLNEALTSSDPSAKITFYATPAAAEAGDETSAFFISAASAANYLVTVSPAIIYVRVYDTVTTCWKVLSFTITLVKTPVITNTVIKSCDFGNDGKEILTSNYIQAQLISINPGILYAPPRMTYKFYETQSAAHLNTGSPLTSFEATATNSVWVNITQNIGDCPIIVELKFKLIVPPILEIKPLIYTICNNNTGNENGATKENVILDSYKNDVLGFSSTNNYTFSYYDTTKEDAISGGSFGKVSSTYTITSFSKTIWVRVTYTPSGCFSIKPIIFQQTTPSLEEVIKNSEIIACANGEMSKVVDLEDYPPGMIIAPANVNDFIISYHISRANAVSNIVITSNIKQYNVTPASQIWIKFVNKTTGCYIIKKLSVTIYSTPKAQDVFPEVCDETDGKLDRNYIIPDLDVYKSQIITGESNLDNLYLFTYYKNPIDADAKNANTISNLNYTFTEADLQLGTYPNPDSHIIYARIDKQDNTGCFSVVSISFQINKKVPVNPIQPKIFECDQWDNDGKVNFNLSSVKDEISTAFGVNFKYYSTEEDVQNNTNEISNFTNWQNLIPYEHIVYVRVNALGYCDNISSIKLKTYPYIQANDYSNTICEFKSDGKTKNAVNLLEEVTQMTPLINSITGYPDLLNHINIHFYINLSDAQNPTQTNSIPASDLSEYIIPIGVTEIWVRFQSKVSECFEIKRLSLTKLKAPEIKVELTPFKCSTENELQDAIVTLIATNEDKSYNYSFDNGASFSTTKNTLTVNSTRTINYVVVDENGCSIAGNIFVPEYNPPTDMDVTITPIYCNTSNKSATVTVNSVTGPAIDTSYTYEIISPVGIVPPNSTGVFLELLPETYQIKATDNTSTCYTIKSIEITKAPQISVDVQSHIDILCYGENTGSITYIVSNFISTGNYTYDLISNSSKSIPSQIGNNITYTNLFAGKYTFIVTDNISGCIAEKTVTINQPSKLKFDATTSPITCTGANNGKIIITATGGTGAIKYVISPNLTQFEDKFVFDYLTPGFYTVIVKDESGCLGDGPSSIEIIEPTVLNAKILQPVLQEICAGDKDGAFGVTIWGGTPPYSINLNNKNGVYATVSGTQHDFTGLADGKYDVFIKDASGCSTEVEIVMDNAVILNPKTEINYNCVNNKVTNSVTVTVHESNTDPNEIDYALDGNTTYQQRNVFVNVAPGRHTVTARHTNGCEQITAPFIIEVLQPLTLTLADGGLNEIVATATGGGGEYQYTLDGEPYGSVNKFIIYKSGTYTVTVTDKNGCTATATRYFEYIDVCIPNHFTPNGDGINDTWAPGCTINYKDLTFDIFDRYGRVICKYKLGQKWDGRYNGAELPSGDYWYVLKLNDNKDDREFVGHFTLYR